MMLGLLAGVDIDLVPAVLTPSRPSLNFLCRDTLPLPC
jgi:hypothetical protein